MNAIEINGLTKRFGKRTAVSELSLTIEKGSVYALLGQNGAGKTTTIKMLCGLLTPDGGDAVILGSSLMENPDAAKSRLNISPQETAVAPKLSVRENLELMAGIYGAKKEEAQEKTQAMMNRFSLTERANDKAKKLSGGMQRRLSIAMALISEPEIVFLDEPTLGLDVRARRDLWALIEELKGTVTVVLTTHYLEEAAALSDKIGIMNEGILVMEGTASQITEETCTESLEDAFLKLTEVDYED